MTSTESRLAVHVRLVDALRLIVITDAELAAPRSIEEVVQLAIAGGARTVQLRDKAASPSELLQTARRLKLIVHRVGGFLIINDRVDVALASGADGVHLGPDDIPVSAVRPVVPQSFIVGYSTDSAIDAKRAESEGADYVGCGSVWTTSTKDVGSEAIGLQHLDEVASVVSVPVVAIGGITPARALEVARTRAAGVAVVGAVMKASDPTAAVAALLAPWSATR